MIHLVKIMRKMLKICLNFTPLMKLIKSKATLFSIRLSMNLLFFCLSESLFRDFPYECNGQQLYNFFVLRPSFDKNVFKKGNFHTEKVI